MDINTNEKGRLLKSEKLEEFNFIEHSFSTRDFGNQGLHVGDIKSEVLKNRSQFAKAININPKKLVSAQQVHGVNIVRVYKEDAGKGALDYQDSIKDCDALITSESDIPLFAFYADCVPIFIADPVKRSIGIVHSGWKGTLNNIAGKVIDAFIEEFDSDPVGIIAVIGPHICRDCYEVSDDIIDQMTNKGYIGSKFMKDNFLDLGEIVKNQLEEKGLINIELDDHCTSCNLDMFYSHRKENGKTGRMAGIIMLKGE